MRGRLLHRLDDERLAALVGTGDARAFETLYDRHQVTLLSFCRHALGNRQDAEDALQQTFVRAHRALRDGRPPAAVRPWLFAIARNRCRTMLAARSAPTVPVDEVEPTVEGLSDDVRRRSDLRELLAELGRLPEDQRTALVLLELGGLRSAEIAAVVGCRPDKVKALVFQARSALIADRDARRTPCTEIREQLEFASGAALRRGPLRRHLRQCEPCRIYRTAVATQRSQLALLLPVAPSVGLKAAVLAAAGLSGGGKASAATGAGAAGLSAGTGSAGGVGGAIGGGAGAAGGGAVAAGSAGLANAGSAAGGIALKALVAKVAVAAAVTSAGVSGTVATLDAVHAGGRSERVAARDRPPAPTRSPGPRRVRAQTRPAGAAVERVRRRRAAGDRRVQGRRAGVRSRRAVRRRSNLRRGPPALGRRDALSRGRTRRRVARGAPGAPAGRPGPRRNRLRRGGQRPRRRDRGAVPTTGAAPAPQTSPSPTATPTPTPTVAPTPSATP